MHRHPLNSRQARALAPLTTFPARHNIHVILAAASLRNIHHAQKRISLAERCAEGVVKVAQEWVEVACRAKAIPPDSPHRAEEVFAGPVATLRYLRLLIHSLREIETTGMPRLPGKAYQGPDGRLRVPLLPTGVLHDWLAFFPFKVTARMQNGIHRENLSDCLAPHYRRPGPRPAKTVVVLGAGNVSAIPLTDALTKVFQEGGVVLLKMSPVNEYLGPIFERAMQPLIDKGYVRIVYGGADVGAAVCTTVWLTKYTSRARLILTTASYGDRLVRERPTHACQPAAAGEARHQ